VQRAAEHGRRYQWFAQIDVRAYFAGIDHAVLLSGQRSNNKAPDFAGRYLGPEEK
jgi:hypothetical protein